MCSELEWQVPDLETRRMFLYEEKGAGGLRLTTYYWEDAAHGGMAAPLPRPDMPVPLPDGGPLDYGGMAVPLDHGRNSPAPASDAAVSEDYFGDRSEAAGADGGYLSDSSEGSVRRGGGGSAEIEAVRIARLTLV